MANERPISMKTKEYRKVVKPLLERRRRARINSCLNELRNFILEATKQDSVQASKLEKADILEMTVHYLRLLLRQQCSTGSRNSVQDVGRFRAGFTECANEVSMFVSSMTAVNPHTRTRLLGHLSKCLGHLEHVNTNAPAGVAMQVSPSGVDDNSRVSSMSPSSAGLSPCYSLPSEPLSPPQSLPPTPAFPVSPRQHQQQHRFAAPTPDLVAVSSGQWRDREDFRRSSPHLPYDVDRFAATPDSPYGGATYSPTSPSTFGGSNHRHQAAHPSSLRFKSEPPALITADERQLSSSVWRPW